jgi:uncharacterized paraquat-inducible protein A
MAKFDDRRFFRCDAFVRTGQQRHKGGTGLESFCLTPIRQEKCMNDLNIIHCARCKTDIKMPSLTKDEKADLVILNNAKGRTLAIEQVRLKTGLDLKESKALVIHMNKLGHCNRCDHTLLQGENITCPKCKSFNLNLSKTPHNTGI